MLARAGFTVGGTTSGLAGTGLTLQDNGGDDLALAADGPFTFATPVAGGRPYAFPRAVTLSRIWPRKGGFRGVAHNLRKTSSPSSKML